jgi:hypothetical protein
MIGERGILILPGISPKRIDDKRYSFGIDLRQEYFVAARAALSNRTAILFDGNRDNTRKCPYIDIKSRDYTAIEVQRDIFQVETIATAQEEKLIETYGCVVTPMPEMSRIKFLDPKRPGE